MAFRQQIRHTPQRNLTISDDTQDPSPIASQLEVDDAQEWVLFSPVAESTVQTLTASTKRSFPTASLSRLSDFGSLDTAAGRSEVYGASEHQSHNGANEEQCVVNTVISEDEEELDSLDSHLHAFHEPPGRLFSRNHRNDVTLLPTHDGLGTFLSNSLAVRDRRHQWHRPKPLSNQNNASIPEIEACEDERRARIEAWRIEQGKILLDRIQHERLGQAGREPGAVPETTDLWDTNELPVHADDVGTTRADKDEGSMKTYDPISVDDNGCPKLSESFWERITRRVMRDLIGIDDPLLEIILGEALPEDGSLPMPAESPTALTPDDIGSIASYEDDTPWRRRLLGRIARELGIFVHHMSEHPGAFSTYLKSQETSGPIKRGRSYIRKSLNGMPRVSDEHRSNEHDRVNSPPMNESPHFVPTVPNVLCDDAHQSYWGIESDILPDTRRSDGLSSLQAEAERLRLERQYWEGELGLGSVLCYFRDRFRGHNLQSRGLRSSVPAAPNPALSARRSDSDQHHPLVNQLQRNGRQDVNRHLITASSLSAHLKRPSSACGSQSTHSKRAKGTVRNRNYWDDVGSVSSSNAATASIALGAWGEV